MRYRIIAPNCIIAKVISSYHDDAVGGGHYGFRKTVAKVSEHFFWPTYRKDTANWIKACQTCCEIKTPKRAPKNTTHPATRNSRPFADVSVDLSGRMPVSKKGHEYVLNVRCNTTRYLELFPLRKIDTGTVADRIFGKILMRYGAITRIHSDNGVQFASCLAHALADLVNTKKTFSTAFYPASNGSVEASMYSTSISIYALTRRKGNWCDYLDCVMSAYNSSRCIATNCSPHLALYGWDYQIPFIVALGVPERRLDTGEEAYVDAFIKGVRFLRSEAIRYNEEYQKKTKAYHDKKATQLTYQTGDEVYVQVPKPRFGYKKLTAKFEGPFKLGRSVNKTDPPTTFEVLDHLGRLKRQANVNQLRRRFTPPNLPPITESQDLDDNDSIWNKDLRETRGFTPALPKNDDDVPPSGTEPNKEDKTEGVHPPLNDRNSRPHSVEDDQDTPAKEDKLDNKEDQEGSASPNNITNDGSNKQANFEEILRFKHCRGKLSYLIRTDDNQKLWVAEDDLDRPDLLADFQHHTPPRKAYPIRSRINVLGMVLSTSAIKVLLTLMIMATLSTCQSTERSRIPRAKAKTVMDLGLLYDCSSTTKEGLFGFNRISYCDTKKYKEPRSFRAEVFQYRPEVKTIQMHLCNSYSVDKICTRKFFGSDKETSYTEEITTRAAQCKTALSRGISPRGHKIYRISRALAKTKFQKNFECDWMSTVDQRYFAYEIRSYAASIRTAEDVIHQSLTSTKCRLSEKYCVPNEFPKQVIVYDTTTKMADPYVSLGIQEIVVAESLVSIPALGIGSSIDFQDQQELSLDGGYIIKLDKNVSDIKKLKEYSLSFKHSEESTPSLELDRLAGQTARATAMLESRITSLERLMCQGSSETAHIKQLLLSQFADTAASLLADKKGTIIRRMGEGLLVEKCQPVKEYKVVHKRKVKITAWNTTKVECFHDIPILARGDLFFLDGVTRTLKKNGRRRNCIDPPDIMLFHDKDGTLLKLSRNGKWSHVSQKGFYSDKKLKLPKFHVFNEKMRHINKAPEPRYSLLQDIQRSSDLINQLSGMDEEKREALHELLGTEEGTVNLNKLAKGAKNTLKSAGMEIESGIMGMVTKIIAWVGPIIGGILAIVGCYKLTRCLLRRRDRKGQRPVDSIVVRERRTLTRAEEETSL